MIYEIVFFSIRTKMTDERQIMWRSCFAPTEQCSTRHPPENHFVDSLAKRHVVTIFQTFCRVRRRNNPQYPEFSCLFVFYTLILYHPSPHRHPPPPPPPPSLRLYFKSLIKRTHTHTHIHAHAHAHNFKYDLWFSTKKKMASRLENLRKSFTNFIR